LNGIAKVVSSKEEKEYTNKCIIKIQNKKFLLYSKENFEYGDIIKVSGEFKKPKTYKNYKLFDYSRYLRQFGIYGILDVQSIETVGKDKDFQYYLENFKTKLKKNLFDSFDDEQSGFLAGILLGDKSKILDETKQNFQDSSLSHILAISGMHIIYVTLGVNFILDRITIRRKLKNILLIIFLVFFAFFTGGSPSCLRACIMAIMVLISELVYRQNSFYISLLVSLNIILLINPYNIESIGLWLSYFSTFGIVYIGNNQFKTSLENFGLSKNNLKNSFIIENFKISITSNLMILPIIWNCFNKISITFFVSNFLISFIIGPVILLGYICLFLGKFCIVFAFIEKALLSSLFEVAKLFRKLRNF